MTTIAFGIIIFLGLLEILVIADVILSWLLLLGLRLRPKFLADIIDPLYSFVKKNIPTSIGILDLTPIVVLIGIFIIRAFILGMFPDVLIELEKLQQLSK